MIRVAVQDHRRVVRDRISEFLSMDQRILVVGVAASDTSFLEVCARTRADVGVIELEANGWDPRGLATSLRVKNPEMRLVGVGDTSGIADVRLSATAGLADIVAAVHAIDAHKDVATDPRMAQSHSVTVTARLTPRQTEVLRLVSEGLSVSQISAALNVSPRTIEDHKRQIFTRLGARSQAHAVATALELGVLDYSGGS